MKTLCSWLVISGAIVLANLGEASAQTTNTATTNVATPQQENNVWQKAPNGTAWTGKRNGTAYWYKVGSDGTIVSSTDNKEWAPVMDNTWRGADGMWYTIDGDWTLWNGGTNTVAPPAPAKSAPNNE